MTETTYDSFLNKNKFSNISVEGGGENHKPPSYRVLDVNGCTKIVTVKHSRYRTRVLYHFILCFISRAVCGRRAYASMSVGRTVVSPDGVVGGSTYATARHICSTLPRRYSGSCFYVDHYNNITLLYYPPQTCVCMCGSIFLHFCKLVCVYITSPVKRRPITWVQFSYEHVRGRVRRKHGARWVHVVIILGSGRPCVSLRPPVRQRPQNATPRGVTAKPFTLLHPRPVSHPRKTGWNRNTEKNRHTIRCTVRPVLAI